MYYAEGTHPAIIDVEIFQKAKKIMSENNKKYAGGDSRARYPFTSKIVCGICGKNMGIRVDEVKFLGIAPLI